MWRRISLGSVVNDGVASPRLGVLIFLGGEERLTKDTCDRSGR